MAQERMLVPLLTGLAALAIAVAAPTQTSDGWPPISPEELALKDNPASPGAAAMVLYREVYTDDTRSFETRYYRIKILKEEGKKYADVEIPYVEKKTQVEDIRARTVHPAGTAVDFQGQTFDKVVLKAKKLKVQVKAFTVPGVQAGDIIEYSYKLRMHWDVPDVLRNPQNYIITGVQSFPTARWTVQDELFTRRARFSLRPLPKANLQWSWRGLPKDVAPRREPDGTVQLDVENIPAFQEEEYMPPEVVLKSRVDLYYIVGFASTPEWFWEQQGKQQAEGIEKFIGGHKSMERAVREIIAPNDSPETKLRKIYARVQQIRYLSYEHARSEQELKQEGLKENKSVEDVWNRGYASANEINLLFVALAHAAGFEASVVRVTARDHSFFEKEVLNPAQLNAMVVVVRLGSEELYLDPATPYCPFKMLPWNESSAAGIRLGKDGGTLVTTPAATSAEAVVERKAELQLDADGNLQGKLKVTFSGQEALSLRLEAREEGEAGRRKQLEEEVKGWLPAEATIKLEGVSGWEGSEAPLIAEFTIQASKFATYAGRRLLLPVAAFQLTRKHGFQTASRVHAVYFHYPYQRVDKLTLKLPPGYQVESLPAPAKHVTGFGRYEFSCENQASTLRLTRRLVVDGVYFRVQYYAALRDFFERVRASDEEQAVLRASQADARN
jgi:uncharacterized protein DUF3857